MKPTHKILVIRFSSLGDVVLTTPVYKNLKNHWKDCWIAVAVKEKYAGILEKNPHIDQILTLKENESIVSFIRRIRNEKFDILIDLHNNLRSNIAAFFSNVPKIIRYRKAALARRLFVSKRIKDPELNRHTIHRYLEPLKKLGMDPAVTSPEIFPNETESFQTAPLRVLIIQTAYLGDAVLTTPLLSALRQTFPACRISVLCTPQIKEIFYENKSIDELLVMDKRGGEGGFGSPFRWALKLKGRFDVALLPHRSFRSAWIAWLARIPKRIGFNISEGSFLLTDTVAFHWESHDSERNLKLLEVFGIKPPKANVQIPISKDFNFDLFLERHKIIRGSLLVGIQAGSVWKTKRWIPEYFAKVCDWLIEKKNATILFFGSNEDGSISETILSHMQNPSKGINLCGQTNLKTLFFMISKCGLFVTNDSGPMHLASAAQIPLVAIFGPTTKELGFYPLGNKSVVVELNLPCRPCSLHGGNQCPLGHFKCMKDLTPELVLKECVKLLAKTP